SRQERPLPGDHRVPAAAPPPDAWTDRSSLGQRSAAPGGGRARVPRTPSSPSHRALPWLCPGAQPRRVCVDPSQARRGQQCPRRSPAPQTIAASSAPTAASIAEAPLVLHPGLGSAVAMNILLVMRRSIASGHGCRRWCPRPRHSGRRVAAVARLVLFLRAFPQPGGRFVKARVFVTLKRGVLDPQGKTVCASLHQLGYREVTDVRV